MTYYDKNDFLVFVMVWKYEKKILIQHNISIISQYPLFSQTARVHVKTEKTHKNRKKITARLYKYVS